MGLVNSSSFPRSAASSGFAVAAVCSAAADGCVNRSSTFSEGDGASGPLYDLDYDRLFEIAATTGTIVEIDGAPSHLDLDGALARRACAAGVTLAISSDCHRAETLARQMDLGIATARRGWVEARHVLNTRSLADVRAVIARKRGPD